MVIRSSLNWIVFLVVSIGTTVLLVNFIGKAESSAATLTTRTALNRYTDTFMNATLETSKGNITLEFFKEDAPDTVHNFLQLAEDDFYNGIKFHRVIDGFMIQGGDPLTKDDSQQSMWGTGGPGYKFDDEIYPGNSNLTGTISMANAGPNTNGSQFFINVADNDFLNSKHTVFGRVIEGMDVVIAISKVETEGPDRPVEPVIINDIVLR